MSVWSSMQVYHWLPIWCPSTMVFSVVQLLAIPRQTGIRATQCNSHFHAFTIQDHLQSLPSIDHAFVDFLINTPHVVVARMGHLNVKLRDLPLIYVLHQCRAQHWKSRNTTSHRFVFSLKEMVSRLIVYPTYPQSKLEFQLMASHTAHSASVTR